MVASRHRKKLDRLGRPADQRKALIRALTTQVLDKGKIRTTAVSLPVLSCKARLPDLLDSSSLFLALQVKAMAIRKYVDKMVGLAKDGSLHARRQVSSLPWFAILRVPLELIQSALSSKRTGRDVPSHHVMA